MSSTASVDLTVPSALSALESPGFNINFESAPFKFTQEYLDLIGGNVDSPLFRLFEDLFIRGFLAIQKHVDGIASIIQLYYDEKKGKEIVDLLKSRLLFAKTTLDIQKLIHESMDNFAPIFFCSNHSNRFISASIS